MDGWLDGRSGGWLDLKKKGRHTNPLPLYLNSLCLIYLRIIHLLWDFPVTSKLGSGRETPDSTT